MSAALVLQQLLLPFPLAAFGLDEGSDFRLPNAAAAIDDGPGDTVPNAAPVVFSESVFVTQDTSKFLLLSAVDPESVSLTVTLESLPASGTLADRMGQAIGQVPHVLPEGELVVLYTPEAEYAGSDSFTFRASDGPNESELATVSLTVGPWTAPLGIEEPEFGIDETHQMYAEPGQQYDFGFGPVDYPIGPNGPYTHHIDKTHPDATDTANPYGTPAFPRLTIPYDPPLPAGSVVEVHGSDCLGDPPGVFILGAGTAEAPIFVRGPNPENRPVIGCTTGILGAYLILEHLDFDGVSGAIVGPSTHITLRHSEFHDMAGGLALWMGGGDPSGDIVLYNNAIHHIGSWDDPDVPWFSGIGIAAVSKLERVWVVDNQISFNAGPGLWVVGEGPLSAPSFISVGRNVMHHNRKTNVVIVGDAGDVVVTHNELYGMAGMSGFESVFGVWLLGEFSPVERISVLQNHIHDTAIGVYGDGATDVSVIGNVLHDVGDPTWPTLAYGIRLWGEGTQAAIGNTLSRVDNGVHLSAYQVGPGALQVVDNVMAQVGDGFGRHVDVHGLSEHAIELVSNLFHQGGDPVRIGWEIDGEAGIYDLPEFMQAFPDHCEGCQDADPRFVNAGADDLHLQGESPAIDAGVPHDLYGVAITVDFDGTARPQDGDGSGTAEWDIGAYEFELLAALQHTITATAGPGGSIEPSGEVIVNDGDDQAFSIISDVGYHIAEILVDEEPEDLNEDLIFVELTFSNVIADHTIAASFAINLYDVTIATVPANGGTVLISNPPGPQGPYAHGTQMTLTALPEGGFDFVGWSGSLSGANNPIPFLIEGDMQVTATFEPSAPPGPPPPPPGPDDDGDPDADGEGDGDDEETESGNRLFGGIGYISTGEASDSEEAGDAEGLSDSSGPTQRLPAVAVIPQPTPAAPSRPADQPQRRHQIDYPSVWLPARGPGRTRTRLVESPDRGRAQDARAGTVDHRSPVRTGSPSEHRLSTAPQNQPEAPNVVTRLRWSEALVEWHSALMGWVAQVVQRPTRLFRLSQELAWSRLRS